MSDIATVQTRREYMREYKRKQRAEARKLNLCLVCVKNSVQGKIVCDECIARSVEWERSKGWRKKPHATASVPTT